MRELHKRLKKVRMLICDVDGVLTDGRLWISDDGKWRRFFHVHDGVGLKLLMDSGYDVGVISGGKSDDVIQRMAFLKIKHFYLEISDKVIPFQQILDESGLCADEIAFVGDEIYDVPVMKRVGFAVAVADAVPEAKQAAHFVTKKGGGQGAVREVVDLIRHHGAYAKKATRRSVVIVEKEL